MDPDRRDFTPSEKQLQLYILDYLTKRNFSEAATALAARIDASECTPPIDAPSSFLFEWWSVFWDVFSVQQQHTVTTKTSDFQARLSSRFSPSTGVGAGASAAPASSAATGAALATAPATSLSVCSGPPVRRSGRSPPVELAARSATCAEPGSVATALGAHDDAVQRRPPSRKRKGRAAPFAAAESPLSQPPPPAPQYVPPADAAGPSAVAAGAVSTPRGATASPAKRTARAAMVGTSAPAADGAPRLAATVVAAAALSGLKGRSGGAATRRSARITDDSTPPPHASIAAAPDAVPPMSLADRPERRLSLGATAAAAASQWTPTAGACTPRTDARAPAAPPVLTTAHAAVFVVAVVGSIGERTDPVLSDGVRRSSLTSIINAEYILQELGLLARRPSLDPS